MSRVVLKGELHTSRADLDEEKSLVMDGPQTVIFEGKEGNADDIRLVEGWFALSIYAYFWILESVYVSDEVIVELARANDAEIVFTRRSDLAILETVPLWIKMLAGGMFYVFIPASIWIGFVTGSQLTGAYLLFVGIVSPIFLVRAHGIAAGSDDRGQEIAKEIERAVERTKDVLVVVGQGHIDGIVEQLPEEIEPEIHGPQYRPWSFAHLRDIGLPMFKAGLVLFSLYLLSVWLTVRVVDTIALVL